VVPWKLKKRHVYYLLGLTFAGLLLVAISWEFVLEGLAVPFFYRGYTTEPLIERWEYVFTSLSFATVALIMLGWLALRGVTQSERDRSWMIWVSLLQLTGFTGNSRI